MPRPLHVGIDATTWRNDRGFGRFTRELVRALLARDSGIRYTMVFDQDPPDDLPAGVEVITAATKRNLNESAVGKSSRTPDYLLRLGMAVSRAQFDVFYYPAVYSYFPILARVPRVICYHDTTAERYPELLFPTKLNHRLWQAKTALARLQTTRAMTVSEASARDLEMILHIPHSRIDVVTEAADPMFRVLDDAPRTAEIRARFGIPQDATLFVYVGGMNPHKNLLGMLKALPDVLARRADLHVAIVGDTSGKGFWDNVPELKAFVEDNPNLKTNVHFTGYTSDEDLVTLLNAATALVFPSLWEGFGLPAVEAMACGIPVLASRRGSLPEVIGDAGLYFDPESPWAMATVMLRFLEDENLQRTLKARAVPRAASFTWDKGAELAEISFQKCAGAW
jgi:glycosyltransferase involved in cell wall biosynthesis